MTPILFERAAGDAGYLFAILPEGELRFFRDQAACESFAKRQGFTAMFIVVDNGHDGSEA
jgi:hypothetical protein